MARIDRRVRTVNGKKYDQWRVRWLDGTNTLRSRHFPRNERPAALRFLTECEEAEAQRSAGTGHADLCYEELAELFLQASERGRSGELPLSPQTLRTYELYLRRHVLPLMGEDRLSEITGKKTRAVRDALLSRLSARASARQALSVVKASLSYAVEEGLIPTNPASKVTIKLDRNRVDADGDDADAEEDVVIPTAEEVEALRATAIALQNSPHAKTRAAWRRYRPMFETFVQTGLRAGEVRALRHRDIDREARVVRVRRSADSHTSEVRPPKSRTSRREVPLSGSLVEALQPLLDGPEDGYVFAGESGIQDHSNLYHRFWRRLLTQANVRPLKLHALRHYYASRLIAGNFDVMKVSRWMGHHDAGFTLRTYGHLIQEEDREALSRRLDSVSF